MYNFNLNCLRYLLLDFVDILDECRCYSTKMYGGGETTQCQAFEMILNTLNTPPGFPRFLARLESASKRKTKSAHHRQHPSGRVLNKAWKVHERGCHAGPPPPPFFFGNVSELVLFSGHFLALVSFF